MLHQRWHIAAPTLSCNSVKSLWCLPVFDSAALCAMQQYVVLRQHYLTGGEALINEWHQQFVERKEQEEKEGGQKVVERQKKATIMQNLRRMLDPRNAVSQPCSLAHAWTWPDSDSVLLASNTQVRLEYACPNDWIEAAMEGAGHAVFQPFQLRGSGEVCWVQRSLSCQGTFKTAECKQHLRGPTDPIDKAAASAGHPNRHSWHV